MRNSTSSAFASCSLSSVCKVISGISSSGASLSMCLIYIWFQTPTEHCWFFSSFFFSFCSFMRFVGVQTGDIAGGLLEKKRLHSCFPLLFSLFSPISDFYCALSLRTLQLLQPLSLPLSLSLSPSLSLFFSVSVSLFAQRVAWELKTSSAGAASSCSLSAFLLPFPLKITFIPALVHAQVQKFLWCLFKIPFASFFHSWSSLSLLLSVCVSCHTCSCTLKRPVNMQTDIHTTDMSFKHKLTS